MTSLRGGVTVFGTGLLVEMIKMSFRVSSRVGNQLPPPIQCCLRIAGHYPFQSEIISAHIPSNPKAYRPLCFSVH